jgi:hypothetical protein
MAASILALAVIGRPARRIVGAVALATAIVALQSAWLLPVLDARVELILAGGEPADAPYHVLYIGLDVVKLVAVLFAGAASLRSAGFGARAAVPGRGDDDRDPRPTAADSAARSISPVR